jgi:hypothetical protein
MSAGRSRGSLRLSRSRWTDVYLPIYLASGTYIRHCIALAPIYASNTKSITLFFCSTSSTKGNLAGLDDHGRQTDREVSPTAPYTL